MLTDLYEAAGADEGSKAHADLQAECGFSYRTLLGELLYAYVTCRPDIGYAVITLSKFASKPAKLHFTALKNVARYLRGTRDWGIHFHRNGVRNELPLCPLDTVDAVEASKNLPAFPSLEEGCRLTGLLDAAHGNDLTRRRSTTGYVFMMAGGAVSYRCKTQPVTATSSTEAEFYASVTAAKHARYLRSVLNDLGLHQDRPTPLYCDNKSAINMINARRPTERARHILIQYFAIQDWKENGDIVMHHIPGIINPSDDLTKPLGWVLHARHCCRTLGHYGKG